MRTIKFRAWQKGHEKMGKVSSISFDKNQVIEHILFDNGQNCSPRYSNYYLNGIDWNLSYLSIMQFTGLQDKNGKDIYEGDIVIADGTKGEVIYSRWCEFKILAANSLGFYIDIEVIGNIHQNKES